MIYFIFIKLYISDLKKSYINAFIVRCGLRGQDKDEIPKKNYGVNCKKWRDQPERCKTQSTMINYCI